MGASNRLHTVIAAGVIFSLLAGAAFAQLPMPGISLSPDKGRPLTPEEKEKQKAIDDQYQETMKKMPDKRPPADPWGDIRSTSKQRQQ